MTPVFRPTFHVQLIGSTLDALLEALVRANVQWLLANGHRSLYQSGVRYRAESGEDWYTIPYVLERGEGDCEDLACWRAAELRVLGHHQAVAIAKLSPSVGARRLYHIVVSGDGISEDPSRMLGMR